MSYTTHETVSALATPDPELAEFLKANPLPPRDFSDIVKLRNARSEQEKAALAAMGGPPSGVIESEETITYRDGYSATQLVWRPKSPPASGAPLIALFHGGGFCLGSPAQMTPLGRAACALYGAVVVAIKYRLAPEFKFPTASEDAWEGLTWAAENASSLGADLKSGFVVGGVSAGGQLTAALVQKSLEGGLPAPITGAWISVPVVLDQGTFERGKVDAKYKDVYFSHGQNQEAPILDKVAVDAFMAAYQPNWSSPMCTPFEAKNPHKGMPRSYIQGLTPTSVDLWTIADYH